MGGMGRTLLLTFFEEVMEGSGGKEAIEDASDRFFFFFWETSCRFLSSSNLCCSGFGGKCRGTFRCFVLLEMFDFDRCLSVAV